MHRHAVRFAEPLRHCSRGDRFHDWAPLAARFQHVVAEQAEHLELVDEDAVLIGDAHAVGVAVVRDAGVEALRAHRLFHFGQIPRDGLRCVHAREDRIAEPVQFRDLRCSATDELEVSSARSVHRVHAHVQPCGAEAIEVDQPRELRDIRRPRVEHLDEPSRFRLSDVHRRDVAPDERRQKLLELGDDLRRGAAAYSGLYLKPFHCHGLWLAVMTTPPPALRSMML